MKEMPNPFGHSCRRRIEGERHTGLLGANERYHSMSDLLVSMGYQGPLPSDQNALVALLLVALIQRYGGVLEATLQAHKEITRE